MSSQMSAYELIAIGDEDRTKPWLNLYWPQILGVTFGLATGVILNFATRRPVFSGIQKHVIGAAGWTGLLTYVQGKRNDYFAEKDAVLRHYIDLHREDFVELLEPTRKRYADVFEPWVPVR